MSLVDGWCDCQALKQHACLQVQRPALHWQRVPDVGLKGQNALGAGIPTGVASGTNSCMAPIALGQASWKIIPACHQHLSIVSGAWHIRHMHILCLFKMQLDTQKLIWLHQGGNIRPSCRHSLDVTCSAV